MTEPEFEFDVAFSFHSIDESLASDLNDLIQDRFQTFLYSERQEMLAGTDGEETFNAIFGAKARCVVVFYRSEWGETPFTRIEKTAIRNRAYDEGFDFAIFIPTEDPPAAPPWLPKTRLWYGLARFGLSGLAGVIEVRIQELGGEPRVESISDRAARLDRARRLQDARKQFRSSEIGVHEATAAFERFSSALERNVSRIATDQGTLRSLALKRLAENRLVHGLGPVMNVSWRAHFANSLDEAFLDVEIFNGVPPLPGLFILEKPKRLSKSQLEFDLLGIDRYGYVERRSDGRTMSAEELAEHVLRVYFEAADKFGRR